MVLTVARFACAVDKDWIIMIAHHSRTGAVSVDRIGSFQTGEKCVELKTTTAYTCVVK